MNLLRRALLAMAAQVFENRFDSDVRAVEAAFVHSYYLVLLFDGAEQALRGFGQPRDVLSVRLVRLSKLLNGLLDLQGLIIKSPQGLPIFLVVSELHRFLPCCREHSPAATTPTFSVRSPRWRTSR